MPSSLRASHLRHHFAASVGSVSDSDDILQLCKYECMPQLSGKVQKTQQS